MIRTRFPARFMPGSCLDDLWTCVLYYDAGLKYTLLNEQA